MHNKNKIYIISIINILVGNTWFVILIILCFSNVLSTTMYYTFLQLWNLLNIKIKFCYYIVNEIIILCIVLLNTEKNFSGFTVRTKIVKCIYYIFF